MDQKGKMIKIQNTISSGIKKKQTKLELMQTICLRWHKVLIVRPYGGRFVWQKVFVYSENWGPGLCEKQMSSLMGLMKLFNCLCRPPFYSWIQKTAGVLRKSAICHSL